MTNTKSIKRALVSSILVLCLCCTMLVGTTFAWFTDSVTSSNNVIKTGKLDVGFYWVEGKEDPATTTAWKDTSEGAIFDYAKWEPGYAEARHLKVTNEGTLALNYQMRIVANGVVTKLADVIEVYYINEDAALADRAVLANAEYLGTLTEVLGAAIVDENGDPVLDDQGNKVEKHLSKKVYGSLVEGAEPDVHTLVLKMSEKADNEYMDMDLGCTFSVELIASQMASEFDSFDNLYDDGVTVPDPAVPAALVRPLENLAFDTTGSKMGMDIGAKALDVGYQFQPTMSYEDAISSEYRYWHADFFVYANKDVADGAIALAGYYDAWCSLNNDKWVALPSDNRPANEGVRLVQALGSGNITVNWEELCQYGNDGIGFQCGAIALDNSVAGTTLTVELRLYEVLDKEDSATNSNNEETGEYITVGKFTYTFAGVEAEDQTALEDAINDGWAAVNLGSGEYTIPDTAKGKDITLVGNGDTVVSVVDDGGSEGDIDYSFDGSTVTFENLTLNIKGNDHPGYARMSAVYNNCTIVGTNYCLYGDSVFNNCTFNLNNGYVWTWGASNVVFNECTFEDVVGGKAKAILVHNTTETTVTVKDCTFKATTAAETWDGIPVAAVSIDPENGSPDATVIFEGTNTFSAAFNGLYQVKYADEVDDVKVLVDGVEVTVPVGKTA